MSLCFSVFPRLLLCLCASFNISASASVLTEDSSSNKSKPPVQIAFMPDVHFHDVYAGFTDDSFRGIKNSISGKNATIRTMQSQLNSTRLFNESYFALLAALDDVVVRGIKLVALPGDFSDDGQPIHMRGLRKILAHYSKEYDIEFFAAPGNHDPVRPFDMPGGKPDFLGPSGQVQRIFSKGAQECSGYKSVHAEINTGRPLNTICTEEIRHLGYEGIMTELADFGLYPKAGYVYWETPYSNRAGYDFSRALSQAALRNRQYEICRQGTGGQYKKQGYDNCHRVPDASYLVEPVPGLWLLAIDANVYLPKEGGDFAGSGNAGYNKMLTHKTHVLEWIGDVVKRAERSGKQLIAFSHFPMTDFYDGQSGAIAELFGPTAFQLERRPQTHVSQVLADAGLKLHVGGHMHFNDTGVVHSPSGKVLFNIQAPSLAAYVPAYKLMTLHSNKQVEIETVVLKNVPRFAELFEHYEEEHKTLVQAGTDLLWNKDILQSQSYHTFTNWHLRELVRLRLLPGEWPDGLKQAIFFLNGADLLVLSQLHENLDVTLNPSGEINLENLKNTAQWQSAEIKAKQITKQAGLKFESFTGWNLFELAVDFYRLRNAGQLAMHDISSERLAHYRLLAQLTARPHEHVQPQPQPHQQVKSPHSLETGALADEFGELLRIMYAFQNGEPNDHFMLNLATGEIREIN
jgi:3',5'-cyclic AMP phosphodiesterase CpdA